MSVFVKNLRQPLPDVKILLEGTDISGRSTALHNAFFLNFKAGKKFKVYFICKVIYKMSVYSHERANRNRACIIV